MEVMVGLIALGIVALFIIFGRSHVENTFSRLDGWNKEDEEDEGDEHRVEEKE